MENFGTGSALSGLYNYWGKEINCPKKVKFIQLSNGRSEGFILSADDKKSFILETKVSRYFEGNVQID